MFYEIKSLKSKEPTSTVFRLQTEIRLNAGCGGNEYLFYDLKCEINCDIQKPLTKISNFVLCDVQKLPFRNQAFTRVYAFNVIEHVDVRFQAENELKRVSEGEVWIRLDKFYNLANWFTCHHRGLAYKDRLVHFPGPLGALLRTVRFLTTHSRISRTIIYGAFPVLRKMGLLNTWNYYRIK